MKRMIITADRGEMHLSEYIVTRMIMTTIYIINLNSQEVTQ